MQRRLQLTLLVAVCAVCASVLAADTEAEPKSDLYFLYVEHVKPAMMAEYEQLTKDMIADFVKYDVDPDKISFMTISGPELGYAYVMKLDDFGDMDTMWDSWGGVIQQMGQDRWDDMAEKVDRAVDRRESFFLRSRPDLSFRPENPSTPMEEIEYIHYGFYYVIPGHETGMEEVAKAYAELYGEHDMRNGWGCYQQVTGSDLPVYIVTDAAKSKAAFIAQSEASDETLGEKGKALGKKALEHIRRMEFIDGWLRPDLSYPPREKAEATD